MRNITFIYSSASVEALEELMTSFFKVFNMPYITVDDLFYYGVFCKDETYANFSLWDEAPMNIEIPDMFTAACATASDRLEYVRVTIDEILKGEAEKPDWMEYVEMEESCNKYSAAPSTFLRLIPKDDKYADLAEKLLNFLYSVNLMTTALK